MKDVRIVPIERAFVLYMQIFASQVVASLIPNNTTITTDNNATPKTQRECPSDRPK